MKGHLQRPVANREDFRTRYDEIFGSVKRCFVCARCGAETRSIFASRNGLLCLDCRETQANEYNKGLPAIHARRIRKHFSHQLGEEVSELNKKDLETKHNVEIINRPCGEYAKEVMERWPNPRQKEWDRQKREKRAKELKVQWSKLPRHGPRTAERERQMRQFVESPPFNISREGGPNEF